MRRIVISIAMSAVFSGVAQSQYSIPRPPAAGPQAFHFPKVKSDTLPNGMRVLTVEDHSVQVVAVRAVVGVDELSDPAGKEGLYQLMLGALREGTKSHSANELAEMSARIGTAIAPTAFSATPAAFEGALELMGDMLMNPSFEQAGIDRRKLAQAATFRSVTARPATAARNAFYALLGGRQDALTRSYFATEAGVASITRDDVTSFYTEHVGPRSTTLIIVGDVSPVAALASARRVFGNWQGSAARTIASSATYAQHATTIHLLDVPGAATYIEVGGPGPERNARDASAAEILGTITTNRMTAALRERRALMYSGNMVMSWRAVPRTGEFIGATNVAAPKIDSALTEWIGVLRGLRATPPTAQEVENAKRARLGPLWMKTDGPDSVATRINEAVRDGLPTNFLERYATGLEGVSVQDVATAASRYIDLDHLVIVVSGDRKVIEPALRAANIAPVVVIDRDGKEIP